MRKEKVLIFGGEKNQYHDFDAQSPVLTRIAHEAGFDAECTRDADAFRAANIKPFDAICIAASSGILNEEQEDALIAAVIGNPWGDTGAPKGLVGIHGATVLSSVSRKYEYMMGGSFLTHPPIGEEYRFAVTMPRHSVMNGIDDFALVDELYMMAQLSPYETVLSSEYDGFSRPVAWVKPFGLGRIFYCALGHSVEQLENETMGRIIGNGLKWTAKK
jgi:uncharacterized protein